MCTYISCVGCYSGGCYNKRVLVNTHTHTHTTRSTPPTHRLHQEALGERDAEGSPLELEGSEPPGPPGHEEQAGSGGRRQPSQTTTSHSDSELTSLYLYTSMHNYMHVHVRNVQLCWIGGLGEFTNTLRIIISCIYIYYSAWWPN